MSEPKKGHGKDWRQYDVHIYKEHIVIQDLHVEFIQGILFNPTWTLYKGNSFETSLVQISNGQGIMMYWLAFCVYRGMVLLSFKRGNKTSYDSVSYTKRLFPKNRARSAPRYLENDNYLLFSFNPKMSILLKTWF